MSRGDKQYRGAGGSPIDIPYPRASRQTTEEASRTRHTSTSQPVPPVVDDDENEDAWIVPKSHTSAYRYDSPYRSPRTATRDMGNPKRTRLVKQRRFDRYTLMIVVGLALIVMIGGWLVFSLLTNWWTSTSEDWKYGNPRTSQTDQFVGQGDSPDHPDHFIVVNTHGQVIVIQLNPLHPELDHNYGITTASDPKIPVSLLFRPTGNGKWAMYVVVGDTNPYTVEYVSNGKQFVPYQPATSTSGSHAAHTS